MKDSPARLWLAVDFAVAASAYTAAAWLTSDVDLGLFLLYEGGLASIALIAFTVVAATAFQGLYAAPRLRSRVLLAFDLTAVIGVAFLLQAVIHYLDRNLAAPLGVMLPGSALALAGMFAWRLAAIRSFGPERILLAGVTPLNRGIAAQLALQPRRGMTVIGYLDDSVPRPAAVDGVAVLGGFADLPRVWKEVGPHRVIIDHEGQEDRLDPALVRWILAGGLIVEKPAALYESLFGRVLPAVVRSSAAFLGKELAPGPAVVAMQAVYNNVAGLVALVAATPLMALVAALLKIAGPGPAMERCEVMGWNLIPFTLLRFRCPRTAAGEPTRLGAVLRRLRLDGLPQLWNIVRGEISLAGPRPEPAEKAQALVESLPCYRLRFAVKPGITGWTQIHTGGRALDTAEQLEYDLYYVKHLSAALDCYILLNAFKGLFRGERPAARPGTS